MTVAELIPAAILAFAARLTQLGPELPRIFAWRETPSEWVVIFDDGRKFRLPKKDAPAPAAAQHAAPARTPKPKK